MTNENWDDEARWELLSRVVDPYASDDDCDEVDVSGPRWMVDERPVTEREAEIIRTATPRDWLAVGRLLEAKSDAYFALLDEARDEAGLSKEASMAEVIEAMPAERAAILKTTFEKTFKPLILQEVYREITRHESVGRR